MTNKGETIQKRLSRLARRLGKWIVAYNQWDRRVFYCAFRVFTPKDDPINRRGLELFFLATFLSALLFGILMLLHGIGEQWRQITDYNWWTEVPNSDLHDRVAKDTTTPPLNKQTNAEIVRNMLLAAAGLVGAVFGAFQLYSSARRTRTGAVQAHTGLEAERNERFVRASELLKDLDPAVRMAGIFALRRLAEEPGARYTETVVDVIAGYVRERTNRTDPVRYSPSANNEKYPPRPERPYLPVLWPEKARDTRSPEERAQHDAGGWLTPTEPVKAALGSLSGICNTHYKMGRKKGAEQILSVDLRGAQLARLEAIEFFMRGWNLAGANLQGAALWEANLQGAALWEANLQGADLRGANLQGADLRGANLQGADLRGANLQGADLRGANLQGADLRDANLQGADLRRANLQGPHLGDANLQGALLWDANLQGAYLRDANLQGAYLRDANLQGARLGDANLQGAYLEYVRQGAYLEYVNDLKSDYLENAVWPVGLPPNLPDAFDANTFDKRWCTDDNDDKKLHPELLDQDGNFKGVPIRFRERREKELGAAADGGDGSDD